LDALDFALHKMYESADDVENNVENNLREFISSIGKEIKSVIPLSVHKGDLDSFRHIYLDLRNSNKERKNENILKTTLDNGNTYLGISVKFLSCDEIFHIFLVDFSKKRAELFYLENNKRSLSSGLIDGSLIYFKVFFS
jgi:hypothetical protein